MVVATAIPSFLQIAQAQFAVVTPGMSVHSDVTIKGCMKGIIVME
jgi:hypothetical protein